MHEINYPNLCQDSTNASCDFRIQEIQRCLRPLVQAVIAHMKDHFPSTPKELNFHAELKAASQWGWSDDYKELVMKKVPVGDCQLKIAATETLKTLKKMEKKLQTIKANKMGEDSDSSDESAEEQLSGKSENP